MDNSKNNSKFVTILDCCYAGKAIEVTKGTSQGVVTLDDSFRKIGSSTSNIDKSIPVRRSKIILASSQADQSAHERIFEHDPAHERIFEHDRDSHYHGIFSYYLIEGLLGKANISKEGDIIHGDITPDKIYNYIKDKMKNHENQRIRYGAQIPQDGISIALTTYGEKDKEIKDIFEAVNESIITATFPLLILAAKELWRLEDAKLNPHLNTSQRYEYVTIKKKLTYTLSQYGNKLSNWFVKNETERPCLYFTKIFKEKRKNIYSELRALCDNLSYEIVAKITDQEKRCLVAVFHFEESLNDEEKKREDLKRELERIV